MPKEKIIWKNKKAAELYYKEVAQKILELLMKDILKIILPLRER